MNEELSYVGEQRGDENLNVSFYKTVNELGEEVEYIRISIPGNTATVIEEPVNDRYKMRFKRQWDEYNGIKSMKGTPIEQWEGLPEPMFRELKRLDFHYIEQLANAPDSSLQGFQGGQSWRIKAKQYIERNRVTPDMIINAQQAQIEELKQQMAELMAAMPKRGRSAMTD